MLQMMQKKVASEGKIEQELFDKFMCWCESGAANLETAIGEGETKHPQLAAKIKEIEALISQLKAQIAKGKEDRTATLSATASLKVDRKKGQSAFEKQNEDLLANIAGLKKAVAALEKGQAGAFLQTGAASMLRRLTETMDALRDSDRDALSAFLSGGDGEGDGYAPASGEIVGILKQMLDTMSEQATSIKGQETEDVVSFSAMLKSKMKLVDTLNTSIEDKLMRLGEVSVELVQLKDNLDDTGKALLEDKKFLGDMDRICAEKKTEWDLRCKTRSEELLALADTVNILNDDDAMDTFKKTLPSASLLQVTVSSKEVRQLAAAALRRYRGHGRKDPRVALISMALKGGKVSFDEVIKMVDKMVELLGGEQISDDGKKKYCEAQLDKTEDELKGLDHEVQDLTTAIADMQEMVDTLTDDVAALGKGIAELDKSVAEATETRKEEHEDFNDLLSANLAAKDILSIAKNRLNKFYNPKMYQAPETPPSPDAMLFAQLGARRTQMRDEEGEDATGAPAPPPETFLAYKKAAEASNGVMAMMAELEAELDKETQEATVDEKNAQKEYEEFIADSADKRAEDAHAIADKVGAKAYGEMELLKLGGEKKTTATESMDKAAALKDLHVACDWLLENYGARKSARSGEVEALKKAKAALSGADYSLVQTAARRLRTRRS